MVMNIMVLQVASCELE